MAYQARAEHAREQEAAVRRIIAENRAVDLSEGCEGGDTDRGAESADPATCTQQSEGLGER